MGLRALITLAAALPFSDIDFRTVADYDFSELTNTSGNSKACESCLTNSLSCFSGERLYIPSHTNGVIQISSTDHRGHLIYTGEAADGENVLFIRACKMSNTPKKTMLSIGPYGEDATGCATNVSISFEMDWLDAVPLAGVCDGGSLIIQPNDDKEGNRRILVDRIIFARRREHGFYFIIR